jgi:hypothetical protein
LIVDTKFSTIHKTQVVESSFDIDEASKAHILGILRSKLYTDKIYAVIREYSANASDAHTEAGYPERPIHVTLPKMNGNAFDTGAYFKVRDFGTGLNDEQVREVYVKYGKSTKRLSNDQIGGLGLGCKSGFAYSDTFTITAICREYPKGETPVNVKRQYTAYIDESGIGRVALLDEAATNEETGVEICIPVRPEDINNFYAKAKQTFRFFAVKPIIVPNKVITFEDEAKLLQGTGWYVTNNAGNSGYYGYNSYSRSDPAYIIMGGIGYPVDANALQLQNGSYNTLISSCGLRLEFGIGEIEIAANREGVEYKDATKKAIVGRLKVALDEIAQMITEKINESANLIEAKWAAHKLIKEKFYSLTLPSPPKWKGYDINEYIIKKLPSASVKVERGSVDGVGFKSRDIYTGLTASEIEPAKTFIVVNDGVTHWRKRAKYFYNQKATGTHINFIVITFSDNEEHNETWKKVNGWNEIPHTLLSKVEIPKDVSEEEKEFNRKYSVKCFKYARKTAGNNNNSDHWEAAEIDKVDGDGVYVVLDRFKWKHKIGDIKDLHDLDNTLRFLTFIGKPIAELHGVKKSDTEGIGEGWQTLEDYVKEHASVYAEKHDIAKKYYGYHASLSYEHNNFVALEGMMKNINDGLSPFAQVIKTVVEYRSYKEEADVCGKYANILLENGAVDKSFSEALHGLVENVKVRYPMLKATNIFRGWFPTTDYDLVIDYVNLVDGLNKE